MSNNRPHPQKTQRHVWPHEHCVPDNPRQVWWPCDVRPTCPLYTMRPLGCTAASCPTVYMRGASEGGYSLKRLRPRSSTYRLSWTSWCSPLLLPGGTRRTGGNHARSQGITETLMPALEGDVG